MRRRHPKVSISNRIAGRLSPVLLLVAHLENIFQRKLHDSRIPGTTGARVPGAGDFSESLAI